MSLVAKVAERIVEELPHSVVDGARDLIIATNQDIIASGPDIIAPAGGVASMFPYAQVLMGLALARAATDADISKNEFTRVLF